MTSLYSLRSTPVKGEFLITKFDRDYNPEGTYALTRSECSCPRSHKTGCRHRTMLPLFQQTNHINDGWFLDFDTRLWRKPLSEVTLSTADATVEERLAKSFESEGSSLCAPAGPPELAQADLTAAGIDGVLVAKAAMSADEKARNPCVQRLTVAATDAAQHHGAADVSISHIQHGRVS